MSLSDLAGGVLEVVPYPIEVPCATLENDAELRFYYKLQSRVRIDSIRLTILGRTFELDSPDFEPEVTRGLPKPTIPQERRVLVRHLDAATQTTFYRAQLPRDLKTIEILPDAPAGIIIQHRKGATLVER
jgi:hypothetical protein